MPSLDSPECEIFEVFSIKDDEEQIYDEENDRQQLENEQFLQKGSKINLKQLLKMKNKKFLERIIFSFKQQDGLDARFFKLKFSNFTRHGILRLMTQIIDVTDSVNYEESQELNILLQTINASVSHELRNPLNAIVA